MANQILTPVKWQPAHIAPVVGAYQGIGGAIQTVSTTLSGLTNAAATLIKAAALLVPGISDPALASLQAALEAAKGLLKEFTSFQGSVSLLQTPPVVGGGEALFQYILKKVGDPTDSLRPPVDTTDKKYFHSGIITWASVGTPDGIVGAYKSLKNLFGSNGGSATGTGFSTFTPVCKVSLVGGKPLISWTAPHAYDLLSQSISVRDGNGTVYSKVKGIRQYSVYRKPSPDNGDIPTLLISRPFNPLLLLHTDENVTDGRYQYRVSFDYELANGATLRDVGSNWADIDIASVKSGKHLAYGGSFPKFFGINAGATIGGIENITGKIERYLESASKTSSNLSRQMNELADSLTTYINQLNTKIQAVLSQINRIANSLDAVTRSGLFFSAYEGNPAECLAQISGFTENNSSTSLSVGCLINASSSNQTLANGTMLLIKKILGVDGELKPTETLGKLAHSLKQAGDSLIQNIQQGASSFVDGTSQGVTATTKLFRFGPNMQPLEG